MEYIHKTADISRCGKYRYSLWRRWKRRGRSILFIGLNPSTADALKDDPTIRRCVGFAESWGFNAMCMANLFSLRATDPKEMMANDKPIGDLCDSVLKDLSNRAFLTIAAWGANGGFQNRDTEIINLIPDMYCLGKTKDGHPKHPLYLKSSTPLEIFK